MISALVDLAVGLIAFVIELLFWLALWVREVLRARSQQRSVQPIAKPVLWGRSLNTGGTGEAVDARGKKPKVSP
jgi:hypothetical protein